MKALRNTFILILALAALPVMAQSKYAYLHQTANELLQIQRSSMKMSAADTTGISTRVCKTLERLRKDKNFKKDVEDLAGASRDQSAFHRRLADDLVYFLDSFAIEESEVLEKAGLSSKSAAQMMATAGTLRAALREPLTVDKFLRDFDKLLDEVCRAAITLIKAGEDEKSREQRWRLVRRWGLGVSGVSMILADGLSSVVTVGVSTASFTLGGAAVGAAVAQ